MYHSIKNTALQGTNRIPKVPSSPDWMPALPTDGDVTTQLLHTIATSVVAHKAGQRSIPQSDFLIPTPVVESQAFCSPLAAQLWRDIQALESKFPVFEQRWLELCVIREQVLSPDIIVPVLQLATHKKMAHLRPLVTRVIGARGVWIASQYPPWRFAQPTNPVTAWREGKPAERLDALLVARQYNPEQSRELLASTWDKESAADRRKFIEIFATGLSPDDVPLLTTLFNGLPTTAKPVVQETRQILLHHLLSIPDSPLAQEWVQLLRPYFSTGKLVLPTTDDAFFCPQYMVQEAGLQPNKPISVWLEGLLPLVPPAIWAAAAGSVAQAQSAFLKGKYDPNIGANTLQQHLIAATIRAKDATWAALLLDAATKPQFLEMLALLPIEIREKHIRQKADQPLLLQEIWSSAAIHFNWSASFSQWALEHLYQSWIGYYFSKVQQIMPLDIFLHPDTRPESIPGLYDAADKRERWLQAIVPELEKTLSVKKILSKY